MFILVDTCVLINFICIDRLDLLDEHPGLFVVPREVAEEIKRPESVERYKQALKDRYLIKAARAKGEKAVQLDIQLGMHIHGVHLQPRELGLGERSVIAFALSRKRTSSLATDDEGAIRFMEEINNARGNAVNPKKQIDILTTPKLMVNLIEHNKLSIKDADAILANWKGNPSCQLESLMKLTSFRDLIGCSAC